MTRASQSARIEERRVDVGGLSTYYLSAGDGAAMVLLHGDGESALDWRLSIPELARTHRVLAPSLPGHGSTARWDGDHSPEFFVRFLRDFLAATGATDRVVVVGNSLGGAIAVRYAAAHPTEVDRLVLVDSLGLGPEINRIPTLQVIPGLGELSIALSRTRRGASVYARTRARFAFSAGRCAPDDWMSEQRRLARLRGVLASSLAAKRELISLSGQKRLVLGLLEMLPMPTLVIWGERDRLLPPAHAHAALARLPNGTVLIIPGAGHLPQLEAHEPFNAAVTSFLATATPS